MKNKHGKITLAVAGAQDVQTLKAVHRAFEKGIINAVLVGNKNEIITICKEHGIPADSFEIIDSPDDASAAKASVALVKSGKAHFIMKGLMPTSTVSKAMLDRENGLRMNKLLNHIALVEPYNYDKLLIMSDCGINIDPGVQEKTGIIKNDVEVARLLGIEQPKVALITALDKVNEKMVSTVEADQVAKVFEKENFMNAVVEGPLAMDDAVSEDAAKIKGLSGKVAGNADVLIFDDVEVGNSVWKVLFYFSPSKLAGVVYGAKAPLVLGSRSDSDEIKVNSIIFGAYIVYMQGFKA
ncbi:MAG: hypothetical protein A2297_06670 [Elusimicrobia bacterium RIFOXYB2_FULL_48_7]|nr:MAG: hypothetical protein A2297_06670 [Elusimicrobia bacterium RIFOXYB2_FULL_48_7]